MIEKQITETAKHIYQQRYKSNPVYFNAKKIHQFGKSFLELLYPQLSNKSFKSYTEIENELRFLKIQLCDILTNIELKQKGSLGNREKICQQFLKAMPSIQESIDQDAKAIFKGDPAAQSIDEVITCYPGFKAIAIYRIAHVFYNLKVPIFPRILSEYAHQITGIDIHPGATIGKHFFIDHGTGVVIGETCLIGDNVKIYQGVTLGALSVKKSLQNAKRHPTIEDGAVIYSGATVLGGETVIGKEAIIGGNTWITKSVPPKSIVYNKNEVKLKQGHS
jgi:serine O-acetyltransferase